MLPQTWRPSESPRCRCPVACASVGWVAGPWCGASAGHRVGGDESRAHDVLFQGVEVVWWQARYAMETETPIPPISITATDDIIGWFIQEPLDLAENETTES